MSTAKTIRTTTRLVTTTTDFGTAFSMRYFSTGLREYNVTPCHGGDRGFESPRGRQPASPLVKLASFLPPLAVTLYDSIGKSILKSQTLKYGTPRFLTARRLPTTPRQSIGTTPTQLKSIDTFRPVVSVELVVTSKTSSLRRLYQ
ncbi:hypothetical protein ES705_18292 [subsurface metagenome]